MQQQPAGKALLIALVTSMFLWGLSWPSGKALSQFCSAVSFSVFRYLVVVISMIPILLAMKTSFIVKRRGIPVIIISGMLLALYSYFFYMGIHTGAAGAGGVLVTTLNPIVAYTIGMGMERRLPNRNEAAGLLLGLAAGSVLLQLWSHAGAIFESGNLYFLAASFTWAVMSKFTSRGAVYGSSLSFSLWQYVVTLACLLPFMNFGEFHTALQIRDIRFWGNLFFTSAIVTACATTVYFYATTRLGAEKASSYIFMVPLAAAVSSWVMLGERILPHTIVGGIMGIAAVYIINRKPRPVA